MTEHQLMFGREFAESAQRVSDSFQGLTRALARKTDPHTSHAAAKSITPGSSEGRILDALRFGPLTDEELGQVLHPSLPATIATARSRLSKRGLVEACGSKLNSRRRDVLIWRLAGG